MPFGPYKDFKDCVRKISKKKKAPEDAKSYCGWLQNKIEGGDEILSEIFQNYKEWDVDLQDTVSSYYRFETILMPNLSDDFINKEKAEAALEGKNVWKNDDDAIVLDDHRWLHMWANTLKSGNKLFITRQQLRKLHDKLVDELARRKIRSGIDHKSPMNVAAFELGGELETFLKHRQAFLLDPEFINIVGSAVTGADPQNLNVMIKSSKKEYAHHLEEHGPEQLKGVTEFTLDDSEPYGPYIPAFELWAIPVKAPKPKDAKYTIHPMAPIPPASPSKALNDPQKLGEGSYFVFSPTGMRAMAHRKENEIIAFNEKMAEITLPEDVKASLLSVEKPKTFILDGFISGGVYYLIDMPWWGESEHARQTAEQRRTFLSKIPQTKALQRAPMLYFSNREEAVDYLQGENGPFFLVPGGTQYPPDGNSEWSLFSRKLDLSESGSSALIWKKMSSDYKVNALVVAIDAENGRYLGAVGPITPPPGSGVESTPVDFTNYGAYVRHGDRVFTILGLTNATDQKAELGDVIEVSVEKIYKMDELAYMWDDPTPLKASTGGPDTVETVETIRQSSLKQERELSWDVVGGDFKVKGGRRAEAYLVNARYGFHSPLACCYAPWVAVPDVVNNQLAWNYLKNDDSVYQQLKDLGIGEIIGTKTERELMVKMIDHGINFRIASGVELISDMRVKSMKLDLSVPTQTSVDILELKDFYDSIRPAFRAEAMKLSCGGAVPLKVKKLAASAYGIYPQGKQSFVLQAHVQGLNVHADFRATVNKKQAVGWTLNLGKSLLKPMLNRTPAQYLKGLDLSLSLEEVSKKLEGTKLMTALEKKANSLSLGELKTLIEEVWEFEDQVLTQRTPTSPEWLSYEDLVPAGATGSQKELTGRLVVMDRGEVEFGAQKSHHHEYFITGEKLGRRKLTLRRTPTQQGWGMKESYAWFTFLGAADDPPYVISSNALAHDWIPPKGVSALPQFVEAQIPANLRYWKANNVKSVRNRLVSSMGKELTLKLTAPLQFSAAGKSLLIHDGDTVYDAFDFEDGGGFAVRKTNATIPRSPTDFGAVRVMEDNNNRIRLHLSGEKLIGEYILIKDENKWIFQKTELPPILMAQGYEQSGIIRCGTDQIEIKQQEGLLIITGPAIKPGEVIPMDGKPTYFTSEGIGRFWPSMARQPVVVLHGDLKGDVVGFVNKNWYDKKTGWGWAEAVIWHPLAMELILGGKLSSFSIEVLPETIWDAEHQHDHVIGGSCVGLSVVPKGACPTCVPVDARMGEVRDLDGKVYKFGMSMKEYLIEQYYKMGKSTTEISETEGIPRSTLESWMNRIGLNRRSLKEARRLRQRKELGSGRVTITALGTGSFLELEGDDAQIEEALAGGKSRRNMAATLLSVGNERLLVNTPKGILGMLATKYAVPRYVVVENMQTAADLHQLRSIKSTVFATAEQWAYLRANYKEITGENAKFEDLYSFERRTLPQNQKVQVGSYVIEAVDVGFKIGVGGQTLLHASSAETLPDPTLLEGVDLYIGNGSDMIHMGKQLAVVVKAGVQKTFFTKIGHVGLTHDDLNIELQQLAPNTEALFDGAEVALGGDSPVAHFSEEQAVGILEGEVEVVLRDKPYTEYSKQTIMFGTPEKVMGLYVEGYPEEMSKEDVRQLRHGLSSKEFNALPDELWVYKPRVLKRFDPGRELSTKVDTAGPYVYDEALSLPTTLIE